jgi:hypothetical protein
MEYPMSMPLPRSMREHIHLLARQVLIVVGMALILAGCAQQAASEPQPMYTLAVCPLYSDAVEIARAWRSDAYLASVDVPATQVDGDLSLWASFYFLSPSTDIIMLEVTYNSATDSWEDDWLSIHMVDKEGRYPEIADSEWQVDSTAALEVASRSGGSDFLAANSSGHLNVSLSLEKQDQLGVVWRVRYSNVAVAELCFLVDASTGELVGNECRRP